MVHKIKNIILFTILSIVLTFNTIYALDIPSSWPTYEKPILSEAGFIMDLDSNVVLYEKNPDKIMFPASLTKIMTALVVFDNVNNLDEEVFFSYNACSKDIVKNSTVIDATPGDKLSVKECLYAILLPSANDAANALAEHVAGNIHDFSLLMNEKAEKIGMTNTHFVNPTGLHDDNQYSTARDLAIMMSYAVKNDIFMQISSSISYTHKPIRKYKDPKNSNNTMINTNNLVISGSKYSYPSTTSGKTGHTSNAGYCLLATSKKDNLHLVCVTLKSKDINDRFIDAKNLFDFYHKNYKSLTIKEFDNRFTDNYTNLSILDIDLVKCINITCDDTSHITLPKNQNYDNIDSKIHFVLKNNSTKNAIGYIDYFINDTKIGECEILGNNINNDSINIQNLDINTLDNKNNNIEILERNTYVNEDQLIYKDKIGKITISKGFKRLLIILSIILIVSIIVNFFFSSLFMTMQETLSMIINRFNNKIRTKRKLHKKH